MNVRDAMKRFSVDRLKEIGVTAYTTDDFVVESVVNNDTQTDTDITGYKNVYRAHTPNGDVSMLMYITPSRRNEYSQLYIDRHPENNLFTDKHNYWVYGSMDMRDLEGNIWLESETNDCNTPFLTSGGFILTNGAGAGYI